MRAPRRSVAPRVLVALRESACPMSHVDLCEALDVAPRQLTNALFYLCMAGRIVRSGRRGSYLYSLPGDDLADGPPARYAMRPWRPARAALTPPMDVALAPEWPAPRTTSPFSGCPLVGATCMEVS